jgi:formylglycine-generating enzyme required for sulfatase activity
MAGNVAEWTGSSYDPGAYEYVSSLNPNLSLKEEKRKVIRGGSWKDVAYFLRVSSRDYEYADTARSYIGFRTVQDYLGSEKVKIK